MCGSAAASLPGELKPIEFDDTTADEQADEALAELTKLLQKFSDPETPYFSLRSSDVDDALRHLRPPRARQGMVADRRRRRQ